MFRTKCFHKHDVHVTFSFRLDIFILCFYNIDKGYLSEEVFLVFWEMWLFFRESISFLTIQNLPLYLNYKSGVTLEEFLPVIFIYLFILDNFVQFTEVALGSFSSVLSLNCGIQTLSCGHVGSSSPDRLNSGPLHRSVDS